LEPTVFIRKHRRGLPLNANSDTRYRIAVVEYLALDWGKNRTGGPAQEKVNKKADYKKKNQKPLVALRFGHFSFSP
jgi:hypothetical protein